MNLNKTILIPILFFMSISVLGQVTKNSIANITITTPDSVKLNSKSNQSLLVLNYQTGEAVFKVKTGSFSFADSALWKYFFQKNNEIELHFIVTRTMLDLLSTDNKENSAEVAGMLYINNHFHNVHISYSFFNKNGNTIDFANNNIWTSLQCNFSPADFQLDWLKTYTKQPVMLWMSKQPVNFLNTD